MPINVWEVCRHQIGEPEKKVPLPHNNQFTKYLKQTKNCKRSRTSNIKRQTYQNLYPILKGDTKSQEALNKCPKDQIF